MVRHRLLLLLLQPLFLLLLFPVPLLVISQRVLGLEALVAPLHRAPERPGVGVALVVVLEVVAYHEGLAAAALLALVRPLVGVGAHVLLEVAAGGEELPAPFAVAVEGVAGVEPGVGVEAVQGGEGGLASLHGAGEGLLPRVDANVNLQAVRGQEGLVAVGDLYERKTIGFL